MSDRVQIMYAFEPDELKARKCSLGNLRVFAQSVAYNMVEKYKNDIDGNKFEMDAYPSSVLFFI
jgi:hypothetical protein